MTDKYDDDTVRDIVESEGLGYAVQHYMSADRIESEETARLWKEAADAMNALSGHLRLDDEL